jgi:hypothetical protein
MKLLLHACKGAVLVLRCILCLVMLCCVVLYKLVLSAPQAHGYSFECYLNLPRLAMSCFASSWLVVFCHKRSKSFDLQASSASSKV